MVGDPVDGPRVRVHLPHHFNVVASASAQTTCETDCDVRQGQSLGQEDQLAVETRAFWREVVWAQRESKKSSSPRRRERGDEIDEIEGR